MIISQTPLRVSFAGGGTDIPSYYLKHGGAVTGAAINKYMYVIVSRRFDNKIYVNYSRKEIVDDVRQVQHELVREAMLRCGVLSGVEVTMLADVPSEGSGLGSSSCLTVGLLHALYGFRGELVTAETLAREACEIELGACGKPIGKQDQYLAAYGGLCYIEFQQDDAVAIERICLDLESFRQLNARLLLYYTGRTRSASAILHEQEKRIAENGSHLRDLKELALKARLALRNESFPELGPIMHQGWMIKRQLGPGISTSDIEEMYCRALRAGASGGKITGAGGGGFLLLVCDPERQRGLREAMNDYRDLPISLEPHGSRIIFRSDGWL